MTPEDLREWCLSLPGSVEERPFGPRTSVFKVGGKMFALSPLESVPLTVSVKCEPELAVALREAHEAIVPGYHLNKRHWITITLGEDVADPTVRDLIEDSHDLVRPLRDKRLRECRDDERGAILAIVNAAAEAYRGVIPADCWHEPYMAADELDREIAAGVAFWGYEADGALLGVMALQRVRDVDLIRHAYVAPGSQRRGIGSALLRRLAGSAPRPMLVGTWAAAGWAIDFYRRHGFEQVAPERTAELLRSYWTIPDRQIETSVVLATQLPTPPSAT